MGADFIGWRACQLQTELKPEGFLGRLKLRAYKRLVEERVPEERRETIQITVSVTGRGPRTLTYPGIVREVANFERGIPDCANCPLSAGQPLGCYRYVTYPVDAVFERALFEFFVEQVETKDTICNQIYADLISELEVGAGWYAPRGEQPGALAALGEPVEHSWIDREGSEHYLDSAMLLAVAFISLESPEMLVAYTRFWMEFLEHAPRRSSPELRSDLTNSRTVAEVQQVCNLLAAVTPGALEDGWVVLADS